MGLPVSDVTLAVVAGGRGRRMGGVSKPRLVHPDGGTLIERLLLALEPLVESTLIVAPAAIAPAFEPLCATTAPVPRRLVFDPGRGPPHAVATVAREVETPWLAAVAADLVKPDRDLLRRLLERRTPDFDAVVPVADGFAQPLFAVYRTSVLCTEPPATLMAWLAALRTLRLTMNAEDAASLTDVDTPEDAARYGLST